MYYPYLAGLLPEPRQKTARKTALGALPARFRRTRFLIVGCGDVGMRVVHQLPRHVRVLAVTTDATRLPEWRALGIQGVVANLDHRRSLRRLAGLARYVVHLAPPPNVGVHDSRTRHLVQALRRQHSQLRLVYGSTSGVYGNRDGDWLDETAAVKPTTERAKRRVDAERTLRDWGRTGQAQISILRIPGIYALDREGGTPEARLLRATPVLRNEDDSYSNHIHADDLARACIAALWRAKPQRVYHCNDDSSWKMGEYFDKAADIFGLPRPKRISWQEAQQILPATLLSFMAESRRLDNSRIKRELRLQWRYPTPLQGLQAKTC